MTTIVIKNRKREKRYGIKYIVAPSISLFIDDIPERCDICGRRVYVRPKTYFLAQREGSLFVCTDCAKKMGLNPEKLPTPVQITKADLQKSKVMHQIK